MKRLKQRKSWQGKSLRLRQRDGRSGWKNESKQRIEPLMKKRRVCSIRMETSEEEDEHLNLGDWLEKADERCLRTGILKEMLDSGQES